MGFTEILNSLLMIFILMIPGFIFKKKKLIDEKQSKGLSTIITKLTLPALIIDAMQIEYSKEIFKSSVYIFFVVIGVFIIALGISLIFIKLIKMKKAEAGLFAFMLIFANTGFIGIPIINALYGKEALFYASIVEMVNDVLLFTLGIGIIQFSSGEKTKINFKEFFSPGIISILIGYTLFITNTKLPIFIGSALNMVGSATTPLSMFIIGAQLGNIQFSELFGDIKIYIMCFIKLIILPLIVYCIIRFGLKDNSLMSNVLILSFAMPAAVCTAIFAEEYNSDINFATKGILLSTLLCIFTIPLLAIIL